MQIMPDQSETLQDPLELGYCGGKENLLIEDCQFAGEYCVGDVCRVDVLTTENVELREQNITLSERVRELQVDDLTGLNTQSTLREYIRSMEQNPVLGNFGVVSVDLNELKKTNDEQGHDAGDERISEAGNRILNSVRTGDFAARGGNGDEFIIITNLPHDKEEAAQAQTALALRLVSEFGPDAAIGTSTYRPGMTVEAVLKEADIEMYKDKPGSKKYRDPTTRSRWTDRSEKE